jgi:hypothetical protein
LRTSSPPLTVITARRDGTMGDDDSDDNDNDDDDGR